jgi:signal transduction histidine kinase
MAKVTNSFVNEFPSLYKKIRITFLILTGLLFTFFWGVIYIAEEQIEVISLEHKLTTEAEQYQRYYRRLGEKAPLPDTSELLTYWSKKSLPDWLASYQNLGFYEHQLGAEDKHFLILEHPSGQGLLYIVYKDNADDYLDTYEDSLHFLMLTLGTILLIVILGYGLYFVRALSAPLAEIERKINQMSPDMPNFFPETRYRETRNIEQTLIENKNKVAASFIREQEFSRFASHELRTPIMVIQGSTDLLKKVFNIDGGNQVSERHAEVINKAIVRIDNAGKQMKTLTEAFLLLGKEDIEVQYFTQVDLSARLECILHEMTQFFARQQTQYQLTQAQCNTILAPQSFVDIVIVNMLKNAFSYCVGNLDIHLSEAFFRVSNQHNGNNLDNAGFGCGLIIIQRVCERMHWHFSTNNDGKVFIATVQFSASLRPPLVTQSTV